MIEEVKYEERALHYLHLMRGCADGDVKEALRALADEYMAMAEGRRYKGADEPAANDDPALS